MLSADLRQALALFRDHQRGDPLATQDFASMFTEPENCFLCDQPAIDSGSDYLVAEDGANPGKAIISMLCGECMAKPAQLRMHRLSEIMKAMFKTRRVHHLTPNQLRTL